MQNREIIFGILGSVIVVSLLACFIIYILFKYKRRQRGFVKQVETINANFDRELIKTQLETQEQTFHHISAELHDNVAQFISLARLSLNNLAVIDNEYVRSSVQSTIKTLSSCLDEVRSLSQNLSSQYIKSAGLLKVVEDQVEQLERSRQFSVNFKVTGKTRLLCEEKEIVLFRIIQESINNVIRHSQADKLSILLHFGQKNMHLIISDNGVGFNVDEKLDLSKTNGSAGLSNIIKRAQVINATYAIQSSAEYGTTISISTVY
jgi:two-component system NarL family sensor kinase